MSDLALAWRLETALAQAWPSLHTVRAGDWLCRMAGGVSRRANSANPIGPNSRMSQPVIEAIVSAYDTVGQPAFVRILSLLGGADDHMLEAQGWGLEGGTLTLAGPLDGKGGGDIELAPGPSAEWLAALNRINGRGPEASGAFEGVLAHLQAPAMFAAARRDGQLVAGAYGVLHDGWLCVEAVATDPAWRGQGLARRVVSALLAWGRSQGGEGGCLQVSEDNAAGRALYRRLGFDRELSRYHYRRRNLP